MKAMQTLVAKFVDWLPVQMAANRWREAPRGWGQAKSRGRGYDDRTILDKVVAATRFAAADPDIWERDSVIFRNDGPHWQILSSLLYAWNDARTPLRVADFGGSLGSLWWRHRGVLSARGNVLWTVVEQPMFVAAGTEFAGTHLQFSEHIPVAAVDVLLASCVLNYLDAPYAHLSNFADSGAQWLLLDRVPLVESSVDKAMVQSVHPRIYPASYPCWFFSRERFEAAIAKEWSPVACWSERLRSRPDVEWKGGLFRRNRLHDLEMP